MILERSFKTAEELSLTRQRIIQYLEEAGYQRISKDPELVFQRGTHLGSFLSFTPKDRLTTIQVELKIGPDFLTYILIRMDINAYGWLGSKRERDMFEREMTGIIHSAGGNDAQPTAYELLTDRQSMENRALRGANCFYWIAGLSIFNSIIVLLFRGKMSFFFGLGSTQWVNTTISAVLERISAEITAILPSIGLAANIFLAGIFALCGFLARKRYPWVYILGMVLYALDGLISLLFHDAFGFLFHLILLGMLFHGLQAVIQLSMIPPSKDLPKT